MRSFLCAALFCFALPVAAASFDYHGSLQDGGKPADGKYDLQLTLYSDAAGGKVVGGPLVLYAVPVRNGSFDTQADFGPLTNAQNAWLGVSVRTAGSGDFSALGTRAAVTATTTGSVCPGAWTLAGNAGNPAGSYLGTADSNPLVFAVNGSQAGSLIPTTDATYTNAPNVVFGSSGNNVGTAVGATVGGGGSSAVQCQLLGATSPSACINKATANFATVGGGLYGTATGASSAVGGGEYNIASGMASTVAGGHLNSATSYGATVIGGYDNEAIGSGSTVGGSNSVATGEAATALGADVLAGGDFSLAVGVYARTRDASATPGCTLGLCGDYNTFIWGDGTSTFQNNFTSTGPQQFLIQASGGVGIGTNNPNGYQLRVSATNSAIEGESTNTSAYAVSGINDGTGSSGQSGGGVYGSTASSIGFGVVGYAGATSGFATGVSGTSTSSSGYGVQGHATATSGTAIGIYGESASSSGYGVQGVSTTTGGYGVFGVTNVEGSFGIVAANKAGGYSLYVGGTGATSGAVISSDVGAYLSAGGQWVNKSDRAAKAGFQMIDVGHVLDEVVAMPVSRWFYKTEGDAFHHIGPVAQDFYAAFGLGRDDKTIGTVDEGGVALAAIQGLNKKVESENNSLRNENANLRQRLDALAARLSALEHGKGG